MKEKLKAYIEHHVRASVADILLIAEEYKPADSDFDTISAVIWERGDTADICHAAHTGGRIAQLDHLARTMGIELDEETTKLLKWAEVIHPE